MNVGHAQIPSRPPPFAKILRDQGKVTQETLDQALLLSAREARYLGQILCEIGQIRTADIEAALAIQQAFRIR